MSLKSKLSNAYDVIKYRGKQSLSKLAELTNQTKSSVYRQIKKIKHRSQIIGANYFETPEGENWLRHLVLATTLVFGLQGKIGEDRLALFFELICVTRFIGVSASSMGRLKITMMIKLQEYQKELQPMLDKIAAELSIVAGVDETFFDRLLILLFMDLSSGFIFLEEDAPDRKASTWSNKTASIRQKFKKILCLASDRAKSLIKFSKDSDVTSVAELYHLQQSVVRVFKYSFASKHRSLDKQAKSIQKSLDKLIKAKDEPAVIQEREEALKKIIEKKATVTRGQATYREQIKTISTVVHPFDQCSQPKTSATLVNQMQSSLTELRGILTVCDIKDTKKRLNYFDNNIESMSALVDLWWQWIDRDLEHCNTDSSLVLWLKTKLLPVFYWKQQMSKSRGTKLLKEHYAKLHLKAKDNLNSDPLTNKFLTPQWEGWAKEWVLKFQRSTSQVEGRNARLSENHHCLRGMSSLQIKADTFLHNFWITRNDGTTAAERLFKFKPPNVFEWLCENMPELAEPRKRWNKRSTNVDAQLDVILAT